MCKFGDTDVNNKQEIQPQAQTTLDCFYSDTVNL